MWNPFKAKGPRVTFLPLHKTVAIQAGSTVLEAAEQHGIPLNHSCGGNLACSTCHVYTHQGAQHLSPASLAEDNMLESVQHVTANSRLACQVHVSHDLTVEIPSQ
ncbi:MAG: 2Fe-2S iron-sulfur cluster-binding protein [Ghiorsea sp.]